MKKTILLFFRYFHGNGPLELDVYDFVTAVAVLAK